MKNKHTFLTAKFFQLTGFGALCVLSAFAIGIQTVGNVQPFSHSEAAVEEITNNGAPAGDVNGDGKLDLQDVITILDISEGLQTASPDEIRRGDMDGDFQLTVKDALRILHELSSR